MLKNAYAIIFVYPYSFRRNLLLKFKPGPKIAKSRKPPILEVQGRLRSCWSTARRKETVLMHQSILCSVLYPM